jgi:hypothetical protein
MPTVRSGTEKLRFQNDDAVQDPTVAVRKVIAATSSGSGAGPKPDVWL